MESSGGDRTQRSPSPQNGGSGRIAHMIASAALAVTDAQRSSLGRTDPDEGAPKSQLAPSSAKGEEESANDENGGLDDSLSPSAVAKDPEATSPTSQARRRSGRERTSTRVYIDGNPVLAINNYVLKGGKYEYGKSHDDGPKTKPQRRQPPPRPKDAAAGAGGHGDGDYDNAEGSPVAKKARRAVSAAEAGRRNHNSRVDRRKEEKQQRRNRFLVRHARILEPFAAPGVLHRMRSASSTTSASPPEEEEEVQQPRCIQGEMRDYQLRGLNFMVRMHRQNLGMILADEMGLGKTLQTISLLCCLKEAEGVSGPSLVVCPLTVLSSWCSELEKWAPSLRFLRLHASNEEVREQQRRLFESDCVAYDVVVTSYEMLLAKNMRSLLQRQHFNYLVLDEGHKIKRHDALVSQASRHIHCENKLLLTGTPLQNNLYELWSLLDFLYPSMFDMRTFVDAFNLKDNHVDGTMMIQAQRLLDLFMLRRLKTHVEAKLPPKLETRVYCPMSDVQAFWYKAILLKDLDCLARVSGEGDKADESLAKQRTLLLNLVMQLRKCCQHPFLFDGAETDIEGTSVAELTGSSGKLAVLDMLLTSLFKKNHRTVIFSQFTKVLDILDDYCRMRGWNYCRFDGSTGRAKRTYLVQQFNAKNSPYFVILMSTKSGGMGINLQTADTCILYDSDWNPQNDIQAQARVHRIGQTKPVHVYRLVTSGSVEERILQRAERKLLLDGAVTRENSGPDLDAAAAFSSKELLADIKFGCQAIFGDGTKNELPSWEEIEQITDRSRTGTESMGKLKGDQTKSAATFDAQGALPDTQMFGGVDFRAIRRQQAKKERQIIPKTMSGIPRLWNDVKDLLQKRQHKSRLVMVETEFGGHVPVLAANNYDIAQGESSVFDRELKHQAKAKPSGGKTASSNAKRDFEHQDVCQVCLVGGDLVLCKYCPVAVHSACAAAFGMEGGTRTVHRCSHHSCGGCSKPVSLACGLLYACQGCEKSWCEDCLPSDEDDAEVASLRFLGDSHRFRELGYSPDSVAYVHCSTECETSATNAFGWEPPSDKPPCPAPLDLALHFGFVPVDLSELDSESEEANDSAPRRPRKAAVAAAAAVTKLAWATYSVESPFATTKSTGGSSVPVCFDPAAGSEGASPFRAHGPTASTSLPANVATSPRPTPQLPYADWRGLS